MTLIAVLALAWPAAASAQSLAELAKKKDEKKKGKDDTITARDLRRAGSSRRGNVSPPRSASSRADSDTGESGEGEGAEGGEAEQEQSPAELREEARADWSQRLTDAEAEVSRLVGRVAELEQSLANPGVGSVEQRQQRVAQLDTARSDLATARQNVTALQREGRQNGYRR
jgi:hypothetical protein